MSLKLIPQNRKAKQRFLVIIFAAVEVLWIWMMTQMQEVLFGFCCNQSRFIGIVLFNILLFIGQ